MTLLYVHIVAGLSAILAGTVALSATKGGTLHRRAGVVFVAAMVVMGSMGAIIAATKLHQPFQKFNVMAGTFTVYLVATALLTVRHGARKAWMNFAALALVVPVAAYALFTAGLALTAAKLSWFPTLPAVIFGAVAILATVGDVRMLRTGPLQGKRRLIRHLWRMCTAMFIATGSFFAGQAKVFPEEYRSSMLMFGPMLLVLATMVYWWARVRITGRTGRGRVASEPPAFLSGTTT